MQDIFRVIAESDITIFNLFFKRLDPDRIYLFDDHFFGIEDFEYPFGRCNSPLDAVIACGECFGRGDDLGEDENIGYENGGRNAALIAEDKASAVPQHDNDHYRR